MNEDKDFTLHLQIGIIKELHKQNLLTEDQMTRCIELITSKHKLDENNIKSISVSQAQ